MASRSRPGPAKPTKIGFYKKIVADAVREMAGHMKRRSTKTEEALYELLSQAKDAQNEYDRQQWGPVRIIHSMDLLVVVELPAGVILKTVPQPMPTGQLLNSYAAKGCPVEVSVSGWTQPSPRVYAVRAPGVRAKVVTVVSVPFGVILKTVPHPPSTPQLEPLPPPEVVP